MINIILVDDHRIFLDGLIALFQSESEITVVGTAEKGEDALEILATKAVDVLVLDVNMPEANMEGIETAKFVKQKYPKTKILMLSYSNKRDFTLSLMQIGVSGYVLKENSSEELVHAIKTVHNGQTYFGLKVLNSIGNHRTPMASKVHLTEREKDVLRLIAAGKESKMIGEELFIAVGTVNTHKKNLLHKTGVENDKQLVLYAIKEGYVDIDDIDLPNKRRGN